MDLAAGLSDEARPPVVGAGEPEVAEALVAGAIVAVPNVGGYSLVVRAGSLEGEARLVELAADPDGPHYAVGQIEDVRALTSGWTDELGTLLQRCWPGPVEVFLSSAGSAGGPDGVGVHQADDEHESGSASADEGDGPGASAGRHTAAQDRVPEDGASEDGASENSASEDNAPEDGAPEYGAWAVVVGMPDGRALRRLCREQGPWRTVPLRFNEAAEVAHAFSADDVALVVDGGRREGATPTVVDATVTPIRVLREGALPASFIEGTMLMSTRRKLFSRTKKPAAG